MSVVEKMSVAEIITEKRTAAGLTQGQLADKIGVTQSMICQIERGTKAPTIQLCKQIANVFGCKIDDLIN